MTIQAPLIAALLIVGSLPGPGAEQAGESPQSEQSVAVLCHLAGRVQALAPGAAERQDLDLFAELQPGTTLQVRRRSEGVVAFYAGPRFLVTGPAVVVVRSDELDVTRGSVRRLDPIPSLAGFATLSAPEAVPVQTGAGTDGATPGHGLPIRLYPADGATASADAATLLFSPVPGAERYWVEVKNFRGGTVLEAETGLSELEIPEGVLLPRALYRWLVRVRRPDQIEGEGHASFMTVSRETAQQRDELASAATAGEDLSLLLLLAEVDRRIGFRLEACSDLARAAALAPDDPAVARTREEMECSVATAPAWSPDHGLDRHD